MRFGSVCSGIEAASVAWEPLGWEAAWLSEIEAFPSAVLAHHWPDVPNLGDMLALPQRVATSEVEAPDVLVGGTPCQAFSVAGRRESLADARGNLTLTYVELADAIDDKRNERGDPPTIIVWENVPGVLNTKDNAFGCFLAGLAGEDVPLQPPGKRWTNAGLVLGPKRAVAWRILDAQYFGLAQRRRRVFVVASARNGFDPSQVLLEFDGLRRDTAPRREAGQETPRDAGQGAAGASHWDAVTNPHPTLNQSHNTGGIGASNQEVFSQRGSGLVSNQKWPAEVASTLNAAFGSKLGLEDQHINGGAPLFVPAADPRACAFAQNTRNEVHLVGGDGSLVGGLAAQPGMKQTSYVAVSTGGDIAHTLNTANNGKGCSEDGTGRGVPTIAFHANAQASQLPSEARDTSISDSLTCSQQAAVATIAFSSKDCSADVTEDMAPTLRAGSHTDSHANSGVPPAVTVALRGRAGGATAEVGGEVATALRASSGGGDKPHVLATMEVAGTMKACAGTSGGWSNSADHAAAGYMQVDHNLAVRRLTPTECERLQGFPDGHTDVPYRKKPAADGPRYKALGNSMAVPVMAWIGRRIANYIA